jgi:arabinofuranosyltransferase
MQPEDRSPTDRRRIAWGLSLLGLGVFTYVFVQNAWVSEDAYITFRSLEQLAAGNGPRWNPHERVQAFTHPLWLVVLSLFRLLSRDVFLNAILASYLACVAALVLVRRELSSGWRWSALILLLIASKSFVDYTSSGLENPLSYLLLVLFFALLVRVGASSGDELGGLARLSLVFSLLLLSRHDMVTLVGPAYAWSLWHHRRLGVRCLWRPVLLGLSPFVLWTLFSLFYYGFPLPNSAYAKLNTGIAKWHLCVQGGRYLRSLVRFDLLLAVVTVAALVRGLLSSAAPVRVAALGLVTNVLYVVYVGGDFMAGRFLACAYLWAVLLLLCVEWRRAVAIPLAAGVAIFAVASPFSPLRTTPSYEYRTVHEGVGDERGIFFQKTSLYQWYTARPGAVFPQYRWSRQGRAASSSKPRVIEKSNVGMFGYWVGTDKIVVDRLALTDPLLARLPSWKLWRIGHFARTAPEGYLEGLETGQNLVEDPKLRRFYAEIRRITQGDLLAAGRFKAILVMNLGGYDHLLEPD